MNEFKDTTWIKNYRSIKNWKFYKRPDYAHLWQHILREAHHKEEPTYDGYGNLIKKGQFSTGRERLSQETGLSAAKVQRILKKLENAHQIEQQMCGKCRIITVTNWDVYQNVNSKVNIKRTSSEHQVNSKRTQNKNVKNVKNEKNEKNIDPALLINTWNNKFPTRIYSAFSFGSGLHMQEYLNSIEHLDTLDQWESLFTRCKESKFLMDNSFFTLTWIIRYDNILKVLSSAYDKKKTDYSFLEDFHDEDRFYDTNRQA